MPNNHREFWLDFDHDGYKPYARVDVYEVPVDGLNKDSIHVIEYAALEEAKAEIERLNAETFSSMVHIKCSANIQSLKDRLAIAVGALTEIRSYSLGSKADICDSALAKIKRETE
jgi:hypothetical protein